MRVSESVRDEVRQAIGLCTTVVPVDEIAKETMMRHPDLALEYADIVEYVVEQATESGLAVRLDASTSASDIVPLSSNLSRRGSPT